MWPPLISVWHFPEAVRRVKGADLQAFNPLQLLQNEVGNRNFYVSQVVL